ncbi:MAG: tetratricopeptide repeat protein [Deltaproteobacteria bacterium]|nr:tetratricopeptide repeat protein [Deltaproteobacteria bacterium]
MAIAQSPLEEQQYQRALYLFRTGDYLSSSELSKGLLNTPLKERDKDKALLLLRLSDLKMQVREDYLNFTGQSPSLDIYLQSILLDTLYKMREYEEVMPLGKLLNSGASRYFEGMGLLQLNNLEEATVALSKVSAGDRFYPYAMISLAQIEVMKQDLKAAEGYLKGLLSSPSIKGDGLTERARILLGQVLFERGLFPEAVKEFSRVSLDSPLYGEAAIGQAWSLMRRGDYKRVIPTLKLIKSYPPYDAVEREAMMILGYCFLKLGRVEEAREHYQQLLDNINLTEGRLEEMIDDSSIRQRYTSILLEGASSLTGEEQYYLSVIKSDPTISDISREYEALATLKTAFFKKERESAEKEAYLGNKISGLEERLRKIEEGTDRSKRILLAIKGKEGQRFSIEGFDMNDITYFATNTFSYWEWTLGRKVDDETKRLVILIMRYWIESGRPECRNPLYICHILSFFNPMWKMEEKPEEIRDIIWIIERISNDLMNIRKGEKTHFESMLPGAREKVSEIISRDKENIKKLGEIREKLRKSIQETGKGSEESLASLEMRINERLLKNRYELTDFKASITTWLDAANNTELAKEGTK